jgi:hypothetical protein
MNRVISFWQAREGLQARVAFRQGRSHLPSKPRRAEPSNHRGSVSPLHHGARHPQLQNSIPSPNSRVICNHGSYRSRIVHGYLSPLTPFLLVQDIYSAVI